MKYIESFLCLIKNAVPDTQSQSKLINKILDERWAYRNGAIILIVITVIIIMIVGKKMSLFPCEYFQLDSI